MFSFQVKTGKLSCDPFYARHLAQVSNDFQLQGSLDFHDLNEDNEVTEAIMIHWIHIGCIVSEASLKNCGSSFKWIENRNATFLLLRRNSTLDLAAG